MSVLAIFEDLFKSNAIKLTKIPRGYYSQGLALFRASRSLHPSGKDTTDFTGSQLSEFRAIMDRVGEYLEATITDTNSKDPKKIDDLFKAAVKIIDQHQTRYQIKWTNKEMDFQHWIHLVQKEDAEAEKRITATRAIVDEKKRWFSGIMTKRIGINYWPEERLTTDDNGMIKSNAKYKTYDIEGSASLDGVLLRLRMRKAETLLLSMSCNPQFYKCFPLKQGDLRKYGEKRSQKRRISPLGPWKTVDEALKELKDANMDFLQLVFDNAKYREQNSPIRNIWDIEEGQQVFKGIFGALELYEAPPFPQPDHSNSSSLATRSMSDAYPQNGYPPNQHFWPQPGATQNQYIPPSRAMPAIARLPHEGPSQSNISTTSTFSDESRSLSPAPPPTMASSPSVNVMQRDSTPTPPVPEVKRGWTLRGAFGADKKKGPETKRMEHKAIPLGPNQQESQVAAPSSSSAFLRPAMAEPRVRKRDRFMQIFDYKATEG